MVYVLGTKASSFSQYLFNFRVFSGSSGNGTQRFVRVSLMLNWVIKGKSLELVLWLLLLILSMMIWSRALGPKFSHSNSAAIHTISSLAQNILVANQLCHNQRSWTGYNNLTSPVPSALNSIQEVGPRSRHHISLVRIESRVSLILTINMKYCSWGQERVSEWVSVCICKYVLFFLFDEMVLSQLAWVCFFCDDCIASCYCYPDYGGL